MANPLTPVTATTKNLITALTTSKNRLTIRASCRNCFLPTRTYTRRGKCLTRRARTRVALQHTNMRAKILLTPSRTNDIPLKWLPTRFPTRMGCQIQVRRRVGSITTEADISNLLRGCELHRLTSGTPPINSLIFVHRQINRSGGSSPFLDTIQMENRVTARTRPNGRRSPNHIITNHAFNRPLHKLLLNFLHKLWQTGVLQDPSVLVCTPFP